MVAFGPPFGDRPARHGAQGAAEHKLFEQRLAEVDGVLHNQDNREHDLLDSDDYYQFEGGLAAAVKELSGREPAVYHNDHSRPESPRIRRMDGFLSPAVCRWLIDRARGQLARARIYATDGSGAAVAMSRTNTETDFNVVQSDLVLVLVRARIAAATGLPPAVMELTKVLHYSVGERFDLHFDYIDPAVPGFAAELAARGQRLATFLVYLNDDYEGGQTHFPRVGLSHRGAAGSALFFANVDTGGRPDPSTLHAGLAPTSGEKWLLSQWIRDRTPSGR